MGRRVWCPEHVLGWAAQARRGGRGAGRRWALSRRGRRYRTVGAYCLTVAGRMVAGRRSAHHENWAATRRMREGRVDQDAASPIESNWTWNVEETRTSDFDRDAA